MISSIKSTGEYGGPQRIWPKKTKLFGINPRRRTQTGDRSALRPGQTLPFGEAGGGWIHLFRIQFGFWFAFEELLLKIHYAKQLRIITCHRLSVCSFSSSLFPRSPVPSFPSAGISAAAALFTSMRAPGFFHFPAAAGSFIAFHPVVAGFRHCPFRVSKNTFFLSYVFLYFSQF